MKKFDIVTKPRKRRYIHDDNGLSLAKKLYIQDKNFDVYQKVVRSISQHLYRCYGT